MNLKIKIIIPFLAMLSLLSACQNLPSTNTGHAKEDKKTRVAEINIQLGMAYLDRHEMQRAKEKFLLAVNKAPELPEAWYSIAYYFETTGDAARARNSYEKALALAPKRGDTNNNYGTFLCRNNEYTNAIKHFLVATQDYTYLNTASAYENAGLCAEHIPNPALSKKYFEQALKQDPDRSTTLISLAQLYYGQGNYKGAKNVLRQFLSTSLPTPESLSLSLKVAKKLSHRRVVAHHLARANRGRHAHWHQLV